jgi:hypothetical protein
MEAYLDLEQAMNMQFAPKTNWPLPAVRTGGAHHTTFGIGKPPTSG